MTKLVKAGIAGALLGIGYVAIVVVAQRHILFPRPAITAVPARPRDATQVWLATSAGRVEAWYLPPSTPAPSAPLLIYFHGNAELIDRVASGFAEPRGWGFGVLLVEFPGYGRSAGEPSEATIAEAALAAFDWARAHPAVDSRRIVAYGRSLGGGAAAILAPNRPIAALVLESTFTSVRSFAHRFAVPELAIRDPFDSLSRVAHYGGPTLVLHGDRDAIIPLAHGQELAAAARHGELHVLPCGHNDCVRPWALIRHFLSNAELLPEQN